MDMIQRYGTQQSCMNNILALNEIRIRDPFVLPEVQSKSYYLFGTTDSDPWYGRGEGFLVYQSVDLIHWKELRYAFEPETNFWADRNFWAPEVHQYCGSYYMLASFKAEEKSRGVQILKSNNIAGPYKAISSGPVTPSNWDCLDGTLFMDDEKNPWIVFSHEWTQIGDGAICCAKLSKDLTVMCMEPVVLFHASEAPWSISDTGDVIQMSGENYVTDGPFLFKTASGELKMLWSSFSKTGYSMGIASSKSGLITGPWQQAEEPFYKKDGGHGMLFRTFDGQLMLAIHTPNHSPFERTTLLSVIENEVTGLEIS